MRLLIWCCLLCPGLARAQGNWVNAHMPGYNPTSILSLAVDTAEDRLLAVGYTTVVGDNSQQAIPRYRAGAWDTLGTFTGGLFGALRYGDTLLIHGNLFMANSTPVHNVAAYFDEIWHPFGEFDNSISNVKIIDGELYAIGSFRYVDGHLCNGIARRAGGQWHCFDPPPENLPGNTPNFFDATVYQGHVYACGVLSVAPDSHGIVRYDGTGWSAPGGGLHGGFSWGERLTVYQDDLYLGGGFTRAEGNAGNNIMKWNGSQWSALNGDLQDLWNTNVATGRVYDILHYQDKLLVSGLFSYAGGVQAQKFAVWDGQRWCGYSDILSGGCTSLAIYHDTLFAACAFSLNGEPINHVIKWVGDDFTGETCSTLAIGEPATDAQPGIVPLGAGLYRLQTASEAAVRYRVVDATGREVRTWTIERNGQAGAVIDLQSCADGLYVVHTLMNGVPSAVRFIHTR